MLKPFKEGEASNLYNLIASKELTVPYAKMMKDSLRTDIDQVLNTIPMRESEITRPYGGIREQTPKSLSEIGELFDITRERARQIGEKAIRILRTKSHNEVLKAYL